MQANDSDRRTLDLTPFWKNGNSFHRSTDTPVRDFIKFQATYPEFVGLENLSVADRKARIQDKVDALYDPSNRRRGIAVRPAAALAASVAGASIAAATTVRSSVAALAASVGGATTTGSPGGSVAATGAQPGVPSSGTGGAPGGGRRLPQSSTPHTAPHTAPLTVQAPLPAAPPPAHDAPEALTALQRLDWFIRVRVKKFQLKQSFTILFFLGPVPESVENWRTSPHLIGSHSEFVNSDPEHCANCKDNANSITEGFIDLDDSLERLGFGHKSEQEIEKYIHDEIHWRVQKVSRHHPLPLMAGTKRLLARSMERSCLLRSLMS